MYAKQIDGTFIELDHDTAATILKVPEFHKVPEGQDQDERSMRRRRAEIFDEDHPDVQAFIKKQAEYLADVKRKEALRNEAKLAIAKSANLTEDQMLALFG